MTKDARPRALAKKVNGAPLKAASLVKSGTPPDIIARLNGAVNNALRTEVVRASLAKIGTDVGGGSPEEFGALLHAETVRWTKLIKDAEIKI